MQFLPVTPNEHEGRGITLDSSSAGSPNEHKDFYQMFTNSVEEQVEREDGIQRQRREGRMDIEEMHGSNENGREVMVHEEDFAALEESLRRKGVPEHVLRKIEDKIRSEGAVSVAELTAFIATLQVKANSASLNRFEKNELLALFQKLGFTPQESQQQLSALLKGKGKQVLSALKNRLATAGNNKVFSVDGKELSTLLKAVGLPPQKAEELMAFFAGQKDAAPKAKLMMVFRIMEQSMEGMEAGITNAWKNVLSSISGKKINAGKTKENSSPAKGNESGSGNTKSALKETVEKNTEKGFQIKNEDKSDSRKDVTKLESSATKNNEQKNELGDKIKAESGPETHNAPKDTFQKVVGSGQHAAAADKTAEGVQRIIPKRVAQQVEWGILKNMGQGKSRLTLQLNPPDLGKLHLLLTVQDNELTATIQTHRTDVHKVLTEQMAQLRTNLEQQGIRVNKLDVQVQQNPNHMAGQWHGTEHHNQAKEQREQSGWRARWARLSNRDIEEADGISEMPAHGALRSEGLDIFA